MLYVIDASWPLPHVTGLICIQNVQHSGSSMLKQLLCRVQFSFLLFLYFYKNKWTVHPTFVELAALIQALSSCQPPGSKLVLALALASPRSLGACDAKLMLAY